MPSAPRRSQAPVKPAQRLMTPEDLHRFVFVGDPQVSPDGRSILFCRRHTDERFQAVSNLWMVEAPGGEPSQFTSGGKDSMGRWSPDGQGIALVSGRQKPKSQIFLMASTGGEARPLTQFPEGAISEFKWSPDGKHLAVSFRAADPESTEEARKRREEKGHSDPPRVIDNPLYRMDGDGYFNRRRFALYIVDISSGKHREIFSKAPDGGFGFAWSPDGSELIIAANLAADGWQKPWLSRLYRLDPKSGRLKPVPAQKDGYRSWVSWSPDGLKLAFLGFLGRSDLWGAKNQDLFVVELTTGKTTNLSRSHDLCMEAAVLSDARDVDWLSPVLWSPDSKTLYAEIREQGSSNIGGFEVATGKLHRMTNEPGQVSLCSVSLDGRTFGLRLGTPTHLDEIGAGSLQRSRIQLATATSFNAQLLNEIRLSEPESHWITTPEGIKVQVWVMRPTKAGNAKVPAVLEIHGGPHAQYGACFFHEFQVLTAQGYAVFFSNPRGSKGYGEAHCEAIRGDWGRHDWSDLQAVIGFMKNQPWVDSKRLAVMGGSYGGYMTNWIIGHTDEFAAAVTDRCVSNLVSMAGSSDGPILPETYWKGNPWDKPETLWNQSPLKYFAAVKTPTLIIHSEGDLRCNVEQAEQVFSALKVLGVPTRFVRYPASTSHGLSRSGPVDLRIHRLRSILEWFGKYLPGKK